MSHSPQETTDDLTSIVQRGARLRGPLPAPMVGTLERTGRPKYHGPYSDVYRGLWNDGTETKDVCIKVIRPCGATELRTEKMLTAEDRFQRRIKRETLIWSATSHPNILPFLGYQIVDEAPCLVSPWARYGSLAEYLKGRTDVSRLERLKMLEGATTGLSHLHNMKPWVAHGDLKPENILVLDDLSTALCDFGTSRIMTVFGHTGGTTADSSPGTAGYQAKELISGETFPTPPSDVYAIGGVILSTLSGKEPFYWMKTKLNVLMAINNQQTSHPSYYEDVPADDPLWELLTKCWKSEPTDRPTANIVLEEIVQLQSVIQTGPPPYTESLTEKDSV